MYWLCYRRGTNHVAGNSVEVVLRSNDLRRWRPVIDFESPAGVVDGCAAADGHFCTTPDRLYLFIGTRNPIHSYVSWTDDGVHWSRPALLALGDDHPYTWRVRWHEGLFYSAICHLHHEERPFELIVSEDGVQWTRRAEIVTRAELPEFTEESELYWRPDGELWCIVRANNASMYWSQPPYTAWEGNDLQVKCDAPVICRTAGGEYLAGRVRLPGAGSSDHPTQFQGGEWGGCRQRHHGPLLPHQGQGRTDPLLLTGWRRLLSRSGLPRARQAGDLVLFRCRLLDGFGQAPAFCRVPLQSLGKRYLLGRNRVFIGTIRPVGGVLGRVSRSEALKGPTMAERPTCTPRGRRPTRGCQRRRPSASRPQAAYFSALSKTACTVVITNRGLAAIRPAVRFQPYPLAGKDCTDAGSNYHLSCR